MAFPLTIFAVGIHLLGVYGHSLPIRNVVTDVSEIDMDTPSIPRVTVGSTWSALSLLATLLPIGQVPRVQAMVIS